MLEDKLSFLGPVEQYSLDDFTIMFLQEPDFAFWHMVQHIPRGVTGHYDLCESSFPEIKPLF